MMLKLEDPTGRYRYFSSWATQEDALGNVWQRYKKKEEILRASEHENRQ